MESLFCISAGDQKVCTTSLFNFKYKKQIFWNTNSSGTSVKIFAIIKLIYPKHSLGNPGKKEKIPKEYLGKS